MRLFSSWVVASGQLAAVLDVENEFDHDGDLAVELRDSNGTGQDSYGAFWLDLDSARALRKHLKRAIRKLEAAQ